MTVADPDHMALVSVKAVSDGYPLRGTLQWSSEAYGQLQSDGGHSSTGARSGWRPGYSPYSM
ncbi:MAG: hypothetical protein CM15mP74_10130 [Halieaceae bacterium]|nr:MAG: hypothetical protein CM15mP74_10130 [Halieaceae bacterium]